MVKYTLLKRNIHKKNKKAVSEMVSYVLLVVIAIALSVLVYAFLKNYIPRQNLTCPDEIGLSIRDYNCSINSNSNSVVLTLNLENKGRFNVSQVYVRVGLKNRQTRTQINPGKTNFPGNVPLPPAANVTIPYYSTQFYNMINGTADNYSLEIEPVVNTDQGLAFCNNALISQSIDCN